jgi:hypothetical protein
MTITCFTFGAITPHKQNAPKIQKVAASPNQSCINENSFVTRKAQNQFTKVASPLAAPLALAGNNSDITSNGIGPHPKENPNNLVE